MQFKDEGNQAFQKKEYQRALKLYTKAIQECPNLTVAYANRAACSISLGRWQDGLSDCATALDKSPNEQLATKILWRKAVCLRHLHKARNEWESTVQHGLSLDPSNDKLNEESRFVFTKVVKEMPMEYTNKVPELQTENKNDKVASTSATISLPSLPISYTSILQLTRSQHPEVYQFWYEKVDPENIISAHISAGIEPDTLDYICDMIVKHPNHPKNKLFLDAVRRTNRFSMAQFLADEKLYGQASAIADSL